MKVVSRRPETWSKGRGSAVAKTHPEKSKAEELADMAAWEETEAATGEIAISAKLVTLLKARRPVILAGPPGTGKTRVAELAKEALRTEGTLGREETVQFHRQYSYEDFIEGIKPIPESGKFDVAAGSFRHFCESVAAEAARREAELVDVFLIDEINRADIASTLGEALYLLEDRGSRRTTTAHSHTEFAIPPSVALIGTMNTADRSTAILDFALRRRFIFLNLYPDYASMLQWLQGLDWTPDALTRDDYVAFAQALNRRIVSEPLLGKNMQLGPALFVPPGSGRAVTLEDVTDQVNAVLLPQLEAYAGLGNPEVLRFLIAHQEVYELLRDGAWVGQELVVQFIRAHSAAASIE